MPKCLGMTSSPAGLGRSTANDGRHGTALTGDRHQAQSARRVPASEHGAVIERGHYSAFANEVLRARGIIRAAANDHLRVVRGPGHRALESTETGDVSC